MFGSHHHFFPFFPPPTHRRGNLWPQIDEMFLSIATSAARLGLSQCKPCRSLATGFASALRGHYFPRIQRSNCRRHSASDNIDIVRTEPTRFKSNALSLVAASLCIAIGETSPKTACGKDEDALRDAIVARYQNTVTAREVANKFKTTSRKVREGEDAVRIMLEEAEGRSDPNYDLMVMEAKPEHTQSKFVYRFVSKFAGASIPQRKGYTEWEMKEAARLILSGKAKTTTALSTYGIHDRSFRRFIAPLLTKFGAEKPKEIIKSVKKKEISPSTLTSAIDGLSVPDIGRPTLLTPDEEAMLVAKAEMSAQYSDPHGKSRLQCDVSEAVEKLFPGRERKEDAMKMHAKRVLRRVNKREPGMENKKKRSKTGMIKVGGLSHKRARQSDPRLQWIMVHRIVKMYREATHNVIAHRNHAIGTVTVTPSPAKQPSKLPGDALVLSGPSHTASACSCYGCKSLSTSSNAGGAATSIGSGIRTTNNSSPIKIPKPPPDIVPSAEKPRSNPPVQSDVPAEAPDLSELKGKFYSIPEDFNQIQPRADQVWNCDEIGFDPNGKWDKIVCTHKWCTSEKLWKTRTGERAPFWVSILTFVRADGQCHVPPAICHQGAKLTGAQASYLDGWTVHATESGYFDRDGFFKAVTIFKQYSGASATNPQFLFLDGHDSHWDPDALAYLRENYIYPFFLKSGDSERDQPLDNGPHALMHSLYREAKSKWDQQYVTTKLTAPYFNMIVSAMWREYQARAAKAIISGFAKTKLHPLQFPPTNSFDALGAASIAAMQMGPGKAADELKSLVESSDHYCGVKTTKTVDASVIFEAKKGKHADRNIVIRSAVHDILTKTLIKPVQELKKEQADHALAAKAKFDPTVDKESRMNPDTSAGLFVSGAILHRTKRVQELREEAKEKAKQSAISAEADRVKKREERKIAYNKFVDTYSGQGMDAFRDALNKRGKLPNPTLPELMAVYQHLGYRPCDLPNTKKATVEEFLLNDDKFQNVIDMPPLPNCRDNDDDGLLSGDADDGGCKIVDNSDGAAGGLDLDVSVKAEPRSMAASPSAGSTSLLSEAQVICNIEPLPRGSSATYDDWWGNIQDAVDTKSDEASIIVLEYDGRRRRPCMVSNLEFFKSIGVIVDVPPYGNCAYDALGLGLCYYGKGSKMGGKNPTDFRSGLRCHADANRDRFLALDLYPSLSDHADPESWWEKNILDRICSPGTNYTTSAAYEHWFDATYVAPLVADLFGAKIVVYDAEAETTTTFAPGRKGKITQTHVASLVPPPKDAITLIYQKNHYYWVEDIKPSMR